MALTLQTLPHYAARYRPSREMFIMLMGRGANVYSKDRYGPIPSDMAARLRIDPPVQDTARIDSSGFSQIRFRYL
jgi:hypothetical protein